MAFFKTTFYGNEKDLKELRDNLYYCMRKDFILPTLLKNKGFDPDSYNNSPNTDKINFDKWEIIPYDSYDKKDKSVHVTFEVWDDKIDFRPLHLVSMLHNLEYYSHDNTCNGPVKCSNTGFKNKNCKLFSTDSDSDEMVGSYDSVKITDHSIDYEVFGSNRKILNFAKNLDKKNIKYTCEDYIDYSDNQSINGVYYE